MLHRRCLPSQFHKLLVRIYKVFPPGKYSSTVPDNRSLPVTLCSRFSCSVYMLYVKYCFILSDDNFETNSSIYSLNCLSCFLHILNCKMSKFFGICFFLYFLKLSADCGLKPEGIVVRSSGKILYKALIK